MKKFFLLSIIILLTSFKEYQADSGLTFDYEIRYRDKMNNDDLEFSVFVSKSNPKKVLLSNSIPYDRRNNNLFLFLQDNKFFELRISDANEVNWAKSESLDASPERFNELVETNETKTINNLICNRYIGKNLIGQTQTLEVYISKNNKINDVNFLLSQGIKCNATIKGLVMEMNSINNSTNQTYSLLTLTEIKQTKRTIKLNDENLKKLIKK